MTFFKTRIAPLLAIAALTVSFLGLVVIMRWAYSKDDVLQVYNAPVPVRTIRTHPTAGGVVILDVNYCKKIDAIGKVRISFVSPSREVFLPIGEDRQSTSCHNNQEIPIVLPKDIVPDIYHVHIRATYDINPLKRNLTEEFDSQSFTVE